MNERRDRRRMTRKLRREQLVKEHGGRCEKCGGEFESYKLQFHHRNPATKIFSLNRSAMTDHCWTDLRTEAEKCSLVCAHCHLDIHELNLKEWFDDDTDSRHRDRRVVARTYQGTLFGDSEYCGSK